MLAPHACVHHHGEPRSARLLPSNLMNDPLLQPQNFRALGDRAIDHWRNIFGSSKNVNDVHCLRNVFDPGVTPQSVHFALVRIHREDCVAGVEQILRDAEAGAKRLRRNADDRDGLGVFKNVENGVGRSLLAIREKDHHPAVRCAGAAVAREALGQSSRIACRNASFSCAVPTDTRIASGKPIPPRGRTITPPRSRTSEKSLAMAPSSTKIKLASLGTGCRPRSRSALCSRRRSAALVSRERFTCASSSSAAMAAACARPEVLNGVRSLFMAATSPEVAVAYPMRSPARP